MQQLINNGAQYVVQQAIANGSLPNGTYTVTNVNNAWDQVVAGTNYEFDVQVASTDADMNANIDFDAYQGMDGEVQYSNPVVVNRIAVDNFVPQL